MNQLETNNWSFRRILESSKLSKTKRMLNVKRNSTKWWRKNQKITRKNLTKLTAFVTIITQRRQKSTETKTTTHIKLTKPILLKWKTSQLSMHLMMRLGRSNPIKGLWETSRVGLIAGIRFKGDVIKKRQMACNIYLIWPRILRRKLQGIINVSQMTRSVFKNSMIFKDLLTKSGTKCAQMIASKLQKTR